MRLKSIFKSVAVTLVCALTVGIVPNSNEHFPNLSFTASAASYNIVYPEENVDICIAAEGDTNYVLDLCGGGTETYTPFQLYEKNDSAAQIFYLKRVDHEWYKIVHKESGKCLNVVNGESFNDARFWLYPYEDDDYASQFRFAAAGDSYIIQNRLDSKRIIDLHDNVAYSGAKVHLWSLHDGQSAHWKLIPAHTTYTTISLGDFSTFSEWKKELSKAYMTASGVSNSYSYLNGEMLYYGKMIVGEEVLEYETITYTIDQYGKKVNKTAELPSKIRFTLHEHEYQQFVWFDFTNLTITLHCECGDWHQAKWEVPYPDL